MIEVKADKWTMKQDSFSAWQILRHGEPCKVSPDNCHSALAWELAYASGQEPLPEPVLNWDIRADGKQAIVLLLGYRLVASWTLTGPGPDLVCEWHLFGFGQREGADCESLRDGQIQAEAALRRIVWGKLMPKGTGR